MAVKILLSNLELIKKIEKAQLTSKDLISLQLLNIEEINPLSSSFNDILKLSIEQSKQTFQFQCAKKETIEEMEINNNQKLDDLIGILNEKITNITNLMK